MLKVTYSLIPVLLTAMAFLLVKDMVNMNMESTTETTKVA